MFSMKDAANVKTSSSKEERDAQRAESKERLPPGEYVCSIIKMDTFQSLEMGAAFSMEFVVDSEKLDGKVSSQVGKVKEHAVFPSAPARTKTRMPAAERLKRDVKKIRVTVAACYGMPASRDFEIDDDKFAKAAPLRVQGGSAVSELVGRKVKVVSVPRNGDTENNQPGYYYEFLPVDGAAPATGKAPPLPAQLHKQSFEAAATAAGFKVHPDDDTYAYNEGTEEVIEMSLLKTRLGY